MMKMNKDLEKAFRSIGKMLPMVLGVIMLTGLVKTFVTPEMLGAVFRGETFVDSLTGGILGSVLAGNPVTSYIISGELLDAGVGLVPATAFLVSWVTVGVVQVPAEVKALGARFAIVRNILSFVFSLLIAIITGAVLGGV